MVLSKTKGINFSPMATGKSMPKRKRKSNYLKPTIRLENLTNVFLKATGTYLGFASANFSQRFFIPIKENVYSLPNIIYYAKKDLALCE